MTVFKDELSQAVQDSWDGECIPLREEVVKLIRDARKEGRRTILATASHQSLARKMVTRTHLFDEVLGSDRRVNLKGERKASALVEKFGVGGFDCVGNCADNIPCCGKARVSYVGGRYRPRNSTPIKPVTQSATVEYSPFSVWMKALRIKQWLKNLLVYAPMIASHQYYNLDKWIDGTAAFFCFGLCASATYLLNDIIDLEGDRKHSHKMHRVIAQGILPIPQAALASVVLFISGVALSISVGILPEIFFYCVVTVAYSAYLKKIPIVDISVLAFLYCLRTVTGGAATHDDVSLWMIAFGGFVFLSLAAIKRQAEIVNLSSKEKHGRQDLAGRGYNTTDSHLLRAIGISAGCISPLILALYLQAGQADRFYNHPHFLIVGCVFLFLWIISLWRDAEQGMIKDEDPLNYAFTNTKSLVFLLLFTVVFLLATSST